MTSPTQRSLKLLRDEGYVADIVERRLVRNVLKDFLSCIDIIGIRPTGVIAVQTTSLSNINSRVAKVSENPNLYLMLRNGWDVEVHGWAKKGAKGKRKLWVCKRIQIGDPICWAS